MEELNPKQKALELIEKYPNSTLATIDADGFPAMRIMFTLKVDQDMTVYYLTSKATKKCDQIRKNANVSIAWTNSSVWESVDYKGIASLCDDPETLKKLWRDEFSNYFTGFDDPNMVVIVVKPECAMYACEMGRCMEDILV